MVEAVRVSTCQHFALNFIKHNAPVFVIVWILPRVGGASLNFDCPRRFNVRFTVVKTRQQLRRELRTIVWIKCQRVLEYLPRVRSHV